eukprot:1376310-Rhodomonas_salina.1
MRSGDRAQPRTPPHDAARMGRGNAQQDRATRGIGHMTGRDHEGGGKEGGGSGRSDPTPPWRAGSNISGAM